MCEPDLEYQAFADQLEVSILPFKHPLVSFLYLADFGVMLGLQWLRYPFGFKGSRHEALEASHDVDRAGDRLRKDKLE